jgi:hypothetical protein
MSSMALVTKRASVQLNELAQKHHATCKFTWKCTAVFTAGGHVLKAEGIGDTHKQAKEAAAASLVGMADCKASDAGAITASMQLNELVQKRHATCKFAWECTAVLTVDARDVTGEGTGDTHEEAKEAAAASLLTRAPTPAPEQKAVTGPERTAVTELNEIFPGQDNKVHVWSQCHPGTRWS